MSDLILCALLAGYGVALLAAPLGCFVVWRRMAYFGDTLSHSALLGVSFGLMLNININLAVIFSSLLIAVILVNFQGKQRVASDAILGILAHSSLAIGLVVISFADNVRVDTMSYLFGDLLATGSSDLYWIYGGGSLILAILAWLWNPLLSMSVHAELAQVEGVPVQKLRLVLTLLMALVIAVTMKIVGVLLITSLMIIPAATAQRFAKTPEQMVILSAFLGVLAVSGGLAASWNFDTPAGPSVVVSSFLFFLITLGVRKK